MKTNFSHSLWLILALLLTACAPLAPAPAITPSATSVPSSTPTFLPTYTQLPTITIAPPATLDRRKQPTNTLSATRVPSSTSTAYPTFALLPTYTAVPPTAFDPRNQPTSTATPLINEQMYFILATQNAASTPIGTPVASRQVGKSQKVYEKEGNLYFQSAANQVTQLTNSGNDREPLLSDDGQKIVFYRGEADDNVYSINNDGSGERLIITSKSLPPLGQGEIKALTFVPNAHFLLFNTYLCNPRPHGPSYNAPDCTVGIFSVNMDSGEIRNIVGGLSGNTMQERNFEISPDGHFISVAASGHIDIYGFSQLVYPDAISYPRTKPDEFLPRQYWLPDSSGLIVIVATDPYNEPGTPPATYAAYRYILGDKANLIPLDKFIIWNMKAPDWCISPDRNWLLFAGTDSGDRRDIGLHYLGNLTNGHTQAYKPANWHLHDCQWSPDSKHFVSDRNSISFIGSVDGSLPIPVGGHFIEWIDNTHYYYLTIDGNKTDTIKTYIGEISGY